MNLKQLKEIVSKQSCALTKKRFDTMAIQHDRQPLSALSEHDIKFVMDGGAVSIESNTQSYKQNAIKIYALKALKRKISEQIKNYANKLFPQCEFAKNNKLPKTFEYKGEQYGFALSKSIKKQALVVSFSEKRLNKYNLNIDIVKNKLHDTLKSLVAEKDTTNKNKIYDYFDQKFSKAIKEIRKKDTFSFLKADKEKIRSLGGKIYEDKGIENFIKDIGQTSELVDKQKKSNKIKASTPSQTTNGSTTDDLKHSPTVLV